MARPRGTGKRQQMELRLEQSAGRMIGYVRVSTKDQGDNGHSLDGQRTRLREVADREGFELVEIVTEVESGAHEDRKGLADVQRRVLSGEARGIIFPKVDRLGRSLPHLWRIVEWATKNRVDLFSADEGWQMRDGAKVDRFLGFRLDIAEFELEQIRERTRQGLAAAKAKGIKLGRPRADLGDLPERATEMRRGGMTLQKIADTFNAEGIAPPQKGRGGRSRAEGKPWTTGTVYYLVNRTDPSANPAGGYSGKALAVALA